MKHRIILLVAMTMLSLGGYAQRTTDKLDRGLVAMKVTGGVYLSWRVLPEEYYDVAYNVYRNGTKITDTPLTVSNYTDKSGTMSNNYSIRAVVRGVEEDKDVPSTAVWATSYKEIQLTHEGIKSTLVPNDATCADVDGDGELEIIMKFDNLSEMQQSYPKYGPKIDDVDTKEYSIFECFKLDGTRLWWINCGPNMGDFQNNEQNIAAYDWDGDGKAECVMRLCDGSVVHTRDGGSYTIGNASANVRAATGGGTNWFVTTDGEYLLYFNGETGAKYQQLAYPLKRLEDGETDLNKAWGDGYGHRCSKHFFGAPYFDGRKPSIFLARGIYTRHKMIAYDVNPSTHALKVRWRWTCNTGGPWYGQGYHNYAVADVDWDGRDEIVFGSMVIDDNGEGLSTTALGHGDAEHVGDLDPYRHGQEIYACMEDNPGNNYRDATTSKVYHRFMASKDDGRCMAGNFTNSFPGGLGCSAREGAISLITAEAVSGLDATGVNTNFRIYWDGDLCEETFNYLNGENTEGCVAKYGSWTPIYTCTGSLTNNGTKGTPCFQGDILGDWREEIIMRTADNNIRIYTTTTPTTFRIPTLWADHQYRNAMVWQMCGYNQPPRPSYYLGQIEGITVAPPPFTMNARTEVPDGGSIGSSLNGKHAIVCETQNSSVSIVAGAQPAVLTFNVPTWVQGSAASECTTKDTKINYATYTCTVTGGGLAGSARLVKQGDGILTLPKADFTHTGNTDIWAGVVNFDGTMLNSDLWLNRFAELNSNGGKFKSIKADYAAVIRPGGSDNKGTITADACTLGFGSRLVVDLYSEDISADCIATKTLTIERKTGSAWVNAGPQYLMPVVELVGHLASGQSKMQAGKYVIATMEQLVGSADNIILEGLPSTKKAIYVEDGKLIVEVLPVRDPGIVNWDGATGGIWDLDVTPNFLMEAQTDPTTFVSYDQVVFGDEASNKTVTLSGSLYPSTITVNSSKAYTFKGDGSIDGEAQYIKEGAGTVTMSAVNSYTGGNHLRGGTTKVTALSNQYSETGNLGGITTSADKFTIENGAVLQTTEAVEMGSPMKMVGDVGGVINNSGDFIVGSPISGTLLTKKGSGWMKMDVASTLERFIVAEGTVQCRNANKVANILELQGGTYYENTGSGYTLYVAKNKTGNWYTVNRASYSNKVTGEGTLTIYCEEEKGGSSGSYWYATRTQLALDCSDFEGIIKAIGRSDDSGPRWTLNTSKGMPKGTLDIAEGLIVQNTGKTFAIGKLSGTGKLGGYASFANDGKTGTNTWQIGNDQNNFTWAGTITDNSNFIKVGSCKMTVSGKSNHSGTTAVNGGELFIKAGATLGTGALTVAKGAVLSGVTGTSFTTAATSALTNASYTFNAGATLRVGISATASSGIIDFGGKNVTIVSNAFLQLGYSRAAVTGTSGELTNAGGTVLQNINKLTMNGTIQLHYSSSFSNNIAVGDSVVLWKDVTSFSGTPVLESEIIDADKGLFWDTKDIKKGVLRVTDVVPVGIRDVKNAKSDFAVYDLTGRKVADSAATFMHSGRKGVFIIGGRKVHLK